MSHWSELEKDLKRSMVKMKKRSFKKFVDELFYKQMCKIFGGSLSLDDQGDGKRKLMLHDFRILNSDGQYTCATAQRGPFSIYIFLTS